MDPQYLEFGLLRRLLGYAYVFKINLLSYKLAPQVAEIEKLTRKAALVDRVCLAPQTMDVKISGRIPNSVKNQNSQKTMPTHPDNQRYQIGDGSRGSGFESS